MAEALLSRACYSGLGLNSGHLLLRTTQELNGDERFFGAWISVQSEKGFGQEDLVFSMAFLCLEKSGVLETDSSKYR